MPHCQTGNKLPDNVGDNFAVFRTIVSCSISNPIKQCRQYSTVRRLITTMPESRMALAGPSKLAVVIGIMPTLGRRSLADPWP